MNDLEKVRDLERTFQARALWGSAVVDVLLATLVEEGVLTQERAEQVLKRATEKADKFLRLHTGFERPAESE